MWKFPGGLSEFAEDIGEYTTMFASAVVAVITCSFCSRHSSEGGEGGDWGGCR